MLQLDPTLTHPQAMPPQSIETAICTHLQHEGIGSVYERVVLSRWFRDLARRHGYTSVLEYSCSITKGYDNITLLNLGLDVTVADADPQRLRETWPFTQQPALTSLASAPRADLVWNFAQVQMQPDLLKAMQGLTKKHILVFVPNILNPGTPIHLAYHLLTRTACRHAERGSVRIRTRQGLLKLLAEYGVRVVDSGYIDAPPIPDIAFSIRELKTTLGWTNGHSSSAAPTTDPQTVWRRVQAMTGFEYNPRLAALKPLVGHHIFALGEVQ